MNSLDRHIECVPGGDDVAPRVELWKRVLDIVCIILALPVVVPLGFGIGLLIKLVSPGPVLFKAQRVGLRGGFFYCLKFRTMKVGADTSGHQQYTNQLIQNPDAPMIKLDHKDPRIIPFGRILRSTGLDELPQLLNVLWGEMSLVGPRPALPYEFKDFLPWHRKRCDTLPGLSGLWQVSGKNNLSFERMMELDIWYTQNKSMALDIKIILKTPYAILRQVIETRTRVRAALAAEVTSAQAGPRRFKMATQMINTIFH